MVLRGFILLLLLLITVICQSELNSEIEEFNEDSIASITSNYFKKLEYDDHKVRSLYVIVVRLPGIDVKDPKTKDEVVFNNLQEIFDLQTKFLERVNARIWVQSDFIPFNTDSFRSLLYLGQRYGLYFNNHDEMATTTFHTISKYISRLYFFETSTKLLERYKNIECFISLPSLEPAESIDDIINSCKQESVIFKNIDKAYTLTNNMNGIRIATEHMNIVKTSSASPVFSSFTPGRGDLFEHDAVLERILKGVPIQQQWTFHQVSFLNKQRKVNLARNSNILSHLLERQAFVKDIDLTVIVNCWNMFMMDPTYSSFVFIVHELQHTVDTNGLELSDGDVLHFTIEFE